MEENKKIDEKIEYEEVKKLPIGAFIAIVDFVFTYLLSFIK